MPKFIKIRGEKYKLNDDIEYHFIKKFQKVQKQYDSDELEDPDLALIAILRDAVCPNLNIDTVNMKLDDKNLTFGEVKKLVIDLRRGLENIMEKQISIALPGNRSAEVKNVKEAIEEKIEGQ